MVSKNSGLGVLLLNIRKLNNIGRWSNEFLHQRASVAEHSFAVTQIAQMLGIIEERLGNSIDWKILYQKALNHDVPESLMGDVISPTKNINIETKAVLDQVEEYLVGQHLLADLYEPYKKIYYDIIMSQKDNSTEGEILRYADLIDALIECLQEVKLANKYPFEQKYDYILAKISDSPLESVKFFVSDILPSLVDGKIKEIKE